MAVHNLDPAFAALELRSPDQRRGGQETDFVDAEVIGGNNHVVWEFGPREHGPRDGALV